MKDKFLEKVYLNPIIAAVNDISMLDKALKSPCEVIFLLTGSIFNLQDIVEKVRLKDKNVYIHIDLLDGFSRDVTALRYICENVKPDGIITTKSNLIKHAKELNMFTIQRLFMLDSLSLQSGVKSIRVTRPDAVEILPGIMGKVIKFIHEETKKPIIAGGLIEDKEDVISSLKSGAVGISTSNAEIWYM